MLVRIEQPEQSLLRHSFFGQRRYSREQLLTAAHYTTISQAGDRSIIWDAINNSTANQRQLRQIIQTGITLTRTKLQGIGLSLSEFFQIFSAFGTKDDMHSIDATKLWKVATQADRKIRVRKIRSTQDIYSHLNTHGEREYSAERKKIHNTIIDAAFAGKEPSSHKTLYVVIGSPGGGKSQASALLMPSDNAHVVNADPDIFRDKLIHNFDPQNNAQVQATHDEAHYISDKIFDRAKKEGFSMLYEGTGGNYDNYIRDITSCVDQPYGYTVKIAYVANELQESFRRSTVYRIRSAPLDVILKSAKGFDNFFRLIHDDQIKQSISRAVIFDNSSLHTKANIIYDGKELNPTEVESWRRYYKMFQIPHSRR